MTPREQFAAKVRELIAQSRQLSPQARARIIELLQEARKKILGEIADLNPESYSAAQLRLLKQSIDQALAEFSRQATAAVTSLEAQAARAGADIVSQPFSAAGLEITGWGQLSQNTLRIAQGYTADLITALSQDAAARINAAIQRAFLGGQSLTEIIAQIGKALPGGEFTGLLSPIGERATAIAVNEILRVHSISAQATLEDLVTRHPALKKRWRWLPAARVPRIAHQQASGQTVDVDQPFVVAGEELMYPRDPNGSAENTINCHCMLMPWLPEEVLQPSETSREILRGVGIEVSAGP